MAIDYDSIRINTAEKLLRENGKVAKLITPGANTGTDYDPVYGDATEDDVYFLSTHWKMSDAQKSLVQVNDVVGIMSTEGGIIPDQSINTIKIGGIIYQLIVVSPLQPGNVTMLYGLIARK